MVILDLMKTAVSIPDEVFRKAERLARQLRVSRSELYAKAVESFVQAYDREAARDALDRVYASEPSELDPVLERLQGHAIAREPWVVKPRSRMRSSTPPRASSFG
jgi:hypothetical protein